MKNSIKSFSDLQTWQKCHQLIINIYTKTDSFPAKEKFSLIDQMRRSAISINANITEGFGRRSYKEKLHFYYTANGSLLELYNFIILSKDLGYLNQTIYKKITEQVEESHKLLLGLIRATKNRLQN